MKYFLVEHKPEEPLRMQVFGVFTAIDEALEACNRAQTQNPNLIFKIVLELV